MAFSLKQCFFFLIVSSWQVTNLASSCPEICSCNNLTLCQRCSYNITFKVNLKVNRAVVCCNEEDELGILTHKPDNRPLTEVAVLYAKTCNQSAVDVNLPTLDTYSISIRGEHILKININIKAANLQELDLASNKLQLIKKGIFNQFVNLRKLNLSKNRIRNIFEESFTGLTKLESLDLSENNINILANVFTPLKNLQHLNLSRNNIEFINENYFNNWLLQHLDVSHNNLKKMAPGALQLLPNLARLLLTDNPHLGITQLDTQLLVGTGRRLQQIDASRIGLYQVPEAFTHSVRFLSLAGNRITSVHCGDLDSYPLLQSLDFSDNRVVSIEDDSLGRLEMLLFLNLNKNLLKSMPKSLPDELKYLSINNNMIRKIMIHDLKNLPNLRILLLQSNEISYIEDHVFDDLLSLEMLDLSNNPIQSFSSNTFDGPLSLRDLRLCNLNLSVTQKDGSFPLSSPESIQMLHLQSSPGLARQLLADSAALAAFSHLQYLDLRMNNLTEIRNDLLFYLVQLRTLRLHGNKLNCSSELWLKDWMTWNKTLSNGETCYYSTSETKSEIIKYNCTFPETFTISESLPPVNLYSTEMINKLLRYYGYLSNNTDKANGHENFDSGEIKHSAFSEMNSSNINIKRNNNLLSKQTTQLNLIPTRTGRNNLFTTNALNEKIQEHGNTFDQQNVSSKYLDIKSFTKTRSNSTENIIQGNVSNSSQKKRSGIRLNTPIFVASKHNITANTKKEFSSFDLLGTDSKSQDNENAEAYSSNPINETVYSPYQSTKTSNARYIGTCIVSTLSAMSLFLWASFYLRYRRRRVPVISTQPEDQIEVSNISGGVLW